MSDILTSSHNFRSLSIKDLLQARDAYHYHLMNKANVVGTAIGLYLVRTDDPYPARRDDRASGPFQGSPWGNVPRTFLNSEVRRYSWPCVLALVREWVPEGRFGVGKGQLHPDQLVPKTLYLPDGRMIPVCVVQVEPSEADASVMPDWHWPESFYGGGMPIVVHTQEKERRATAGCLVSDGHTTYALTSRHVCGAAGEAVSTVAGGREELIGHASKLHLNRLPFQEVYPEFPAYKTFVNLDVGLVELSDLNDWTSRTFGLETTGAMADLNELNISLRLIEQPVVASGAASGRLEGGIKALFYRYKSVGGFDYVSDFLIAPRGLKSGETRKAATRFSQTRPGDSGAVWHLQVEKQPVATGGRKSVEAPEIELRPLAIQWGGQVFASGGGTHRFAFALATSLTSVCRLLNVELVMDHNTGVARYWGQMGHYSIGAFACKALRQGNLRSFMLKNVDRISFGFAELDPDTISEKLKEAKQTHGFVPLADVPDMIWKTHKTKVPGGRDDQFGKAGKTAGPEHPTHYADIDVKGLGNKTLRRHCLSDPTKLSVVFWQQFYDNKGKTASRDRGLLPFRVWQFFNQMKQFAANGEVDKFLCAAGLLSHYVGDACQPLHGSELADGYADQATTVTHHRRVTGEEYEEPSHLGAGVHSTYETKMVDRYPADLVIGLEEALRTISAPYPATGHDAGMEIIKLMDRSARKIPPKHLVDSFLEAGGKPTVGAQDALWEKFGQKTSEVMADGAQVLASIWAGAWKAGNGQNIPAADLVEIEESDLIQLYTDENFVPSLDLDHIAPVL